MVICTGTQDSTMTSHWYHIEIRSTVYAGRNSTPTLAHGYETWCSSNEWERNEDDMMRVWCGYGLACVGAVQAGRTYRPVDGRLDPFGGILRKAFLLYSLCTLHQTKDHHLISRQSFPHATQTLRPLPMNDCGSLMALLYPHQFQSHLYPCSLHPIAS